MTDHPGQRSADGPADGPVDRPVGRPVGRTGGNPVAERTGQWSDRGDEVPDPVDDGIAVGMPPAPDPSGKAGKADPSGKAGKAGEVDEDGAPDPVAERDEYLAALQRLQADFENYRKRVQRQQEEQAARAALGLVGKILPVLDTLDLARAHLGADADAGAEISEQAKALEQARAQLLDVLAKEGLERVDEAGGEFDPMVHDAVAHAPAGGDDAPGAGGAAAGAVDEVLRAGYRWRGQVLRPAMVRVRG